MIPRRRNAICIESSEDEGEESPKRLDKVDIFIKPSPHKETPLMTTEEILQEMKSEKLEDQIAVCKSIRKSNPHIEDIIKSDGVLQTLVEYLKQSDKLALQLEATRAMTVVAFGNADRTRAVAKYGAVPPLIDMMKLKYHDVAFYAVSALGNIAKEGRKFRDLVIHSGIIKPLSKWVTICEKKSMHVYTRIMSILCRYKNPSPPSEFIKEFLPTLLILLDHPDKRTRAYCCLALSHLADETNEKIDEMINAGAIKKLIPFLNSTYSSTLTTLALRAIGNMVTGDDSQTDKVIKAGILRPFKYLFGWIRRSVVREAAWTISNIAAGNEHQIQELINYNIIPPLLSVLENGHVSVQKEAAWAITNYTKRGTTEQIIFLIEENVIPLLVKLLTVSDPEMLKVVLDGLYNILECAEKCGKVEKIAKMIEETGGLDKLEELQSHENTNVYEKALHIIMLFFSNEEKEVTENNSSLSLLLP